MKLRSYLFILVAWLTTLQASAQVTVESKIDSVQIFIGQQVHLNVSVTAKKGQKIVFPEFKYSQNITPGVEVLESSVADTATLADDRVKVSRSYTLTSFDKNLYAIPALKVKVDGKTYTGNPVALKVMMVDVDTLHPNQFFPPKDVQNNPFLWSEWSGLFRLSVLMLLLCAVVCYLFVRLRENKPIIAHIRIVKRLLPHQKALDAISKIKAEKMTTSEDQKAYYTKLTDTIRQYINERFGFNAMEMTSAEIIAHFRSTGDRKMIDELDELFQTADLVKFAKYSTLINENDLNLVNAIDFIDQTKLENQPTEERIVPKLSESDMKSRKNRVTIKSLIGVIIAVAIILLAYIIYNAALLMI